VIVGILLILGELGNIAATLQHPPTGNHNEIAGMQAMGAVILVVGAWLIYSGMKPLREKRP